jgi:hypothetical protein
MLTRRKKIFIGIAALLVSSLAAGFFIFRHNSVFNVRSEHIKIGWANDIHAGKEKPDKNRSESPVPKEYKKYVEMFYDEMKRQGIKTAIFDGDITNRSHKGTAKDFIGIVNGKSKEIKTLIAKGNHDGPITMGVLGFSDKKFYYYHDVGNVRIIILDNTILQAQHTHDVIDEYYGGIDDEQLAWLAETLKTEKDVILAMHIPIFYKDADYQGALLPHFAELEKTIRDSGRVKLALVAHFHEQWTREYNGIKYYSLRALTQGGHMGSYALIDTGDFSVQYKMLGNDEVLPWK